jgi:uncharacterized protein (TIGR03083 family)
MLHDPDPSLTRAAFAGAASSLRATVAGIEPGQWSAPGLGEWTVQELLGHTLRGFTTIELYLAAAPAVDRDVAGPEEYYRLALADPGVHRQVADRGRSAGEALGDDPAAGVRPVVERVLDLVATTPDDRVVEVFVGRMRFSDYLATRVVEIALHTLDLQRATGQPASLAAETERLVSSVVLGLADPVAVLLALTGREPLNVFG